MFFWQGTGTLELLLHLGIALFIEAPAPNHLKPCSNNDGSVTLKWERPSRNKARFVVAYEGEIYSLPIPSGKEGNTVNMEVRIENLDDIH